MATLAQLAQQRVPLQQFMAQRQQAPASGAPKYADVWQNLFPAVGTGTQPGEGGPGWTPGYYTSETDAHGENAQQVWHPGSFDPAKAGIDPKYAGMIKGFDNSSENAQSGPSGQSQLRYDTALIDKTLPDTKFGKFSSTGIMSLGSGKEADLSKLGDMHLANADAKYFDPNYGWITPSKNVIENRHFTDTFADTIMPMLASLGFGGVASLVGAGAMPGLMSSVVGGAKNYGEGGNIGQLLMSVAPGLIGSGLGGNLGIPPELARALQIAKAGYGGYNAVRHDSPTGAIGPGVSLAQLFARGG